MKYVLTFLGLVFSISALQAQSSITVDDLRKAQAAAIGAATALTPREISAFEQLSNDEKEFVINQVGVTRMTAKGVMYYNLPQYRDAKLQKATSDEQMALYYLKKANPADPNFNEGLVKLFQLYPAAKDSVEVIKTVNLMRSLSPGASSSSDKTAPPPLPLPETPSETVLAQMVDAQTVKEYWLAQLMPGGIMRKSLPAGVQPNQVRNAINQGIYDLEAQAAALNWDRQILSKNGYTDLAEKCSTELLLIQQKIQTRELLKQTDQLRIISDQLRNGVFNFR